MGYSPTGGPKGLGTFNDTPQTAADLNKLRDLLALMGNYRGGMAESERDAINGPSRFDGLAVFNQNTGEINVWSEDAFDWLSPTTETVFGPESMGPGWTESPTYPILLRLVGNRVHVEGAAVVGSGAAFTHIFTAPVLTRPTALRWIGATVGQGAAVTGMLDITTAGQVRLPYRTGSLAAGQTLPIVGSFALS
ncbi:MULTISPECIES: hypothetical protein [Microbacterium]|uniref:Uncharacterized protein n=1 Tax=Microbacterium paraoxydans TaxID=199592 RepID=A0A1H1L8B4_9MICO|nr:MULTISPECIES: hypothetical protein [Microbacterium]SDR70824.1 hypothetical protein SAMN04489809_0022 [Microbacterium paraoxydans]SDR72677.1 hypothetical protein SAMN04489809_0098 [Microbacterium paraoxydans]